MLSIKQAAAILGVHWKTVYSFVRATPQVIKAKQIGRQWRIKQEDLDDYMKS